MAPELSLAAFEGNSVMPRVRHRAVDPEGKGVPVRLLLGKVPGTAGSQEETLLASKLRQLMVDGVEVRQVAPSEVVALGASRWHVLAKKGGAFSALGGIWSGESKEQPDTRFGESWLSGALSVEATVEEAKKASNWFDGLWASSTALQAANLEPKATERVTVIEVPYQSKVAHHANPKLLLENAFAKEGGLQGLGKVTRLVYVDRYVPRSLLGLHSLEQILGALQYVSGAAAKVVCQRPELDGYGGATLRSAEQILTSSTENNLLETDSSVMQQWAVSRLKNKVSLAFSMDGYVPHRRKLLVQFAPDARYKTLKVLFDQGLDWMKRPRHAFGPVLAGPFVPGETHIVITRNDPLEKEERWK
ncbi:MAG: hypothetical protein IPQ07_16165 [Myxococcales bacterium]|nr:hypothetical protein [Myxococcales bacterium]